MCAENLLCIAHVVLQLREQRDSSSGRHRLEHILLPVLAQRLLVLGDVGGQVRRYHLLLVVVVDHREHLGAIVVDGVKELLAATTAGGQHHLVGSLQVFLVTKIAWVAMFAISLYGDGYFQFFGQLVELVAHLLDLLRLLVPLLNLLRVLLHLFGEVV